MSAVLEPAIFTSEDLTAKYLALHLALASVHVKDLSVFFEEVNPAEWVINFNQ